MTGNCLGRDVGTVPYEADKVCFIPLFTPLSKTNSLKVE